MTKTDRFIILVVLVMGLIAAVATLLLPKPHKPTVVVQVMDEIRLRLPMQDRTETVEGPLGHSTLEIRDGRVRMLTSDCPDKLCVNMGWISKVGQVIVCLPNQVVISIEEMR